MATAPTRPVVAGIADSAAGLTAGFTGLAAVRLAAAEAVLHKRPLRLLSPDPTPVVRAIRASHPALPVEGETVSGGLADALVEHSRAAHLIVTPAHQDGASTARVSAAWVSAGQPPADPFSAQVAAHAKCPVIIEPAGSAGMVGPVLLCADDDAEEPAVTEYAYVEASVRGVDLHVVHVWAEPPDGALSTVDPFAYDAEAAAQDADRLTAESIAGWTARYPDVRVVRQAMHHPNIAQALLKLSASAALIVVGVRHHARLSAQLVGSVTGPLIGRTHCALAIVPMRCAWPARSRS